MTEEQEQRLDSLFSLAFPTNHHALLDYAALKFELQELRQDKARLNWIFEYCRVEHDGYYSSLELDQREDLDAAMKGEV